MGLSNSKLAITALLNKVNRYWKGNQNIAIEMLENAVKNEWRDIYEPKHNNVKPIRRSPVSNDNGLNIVGN